MIRTSLRYCVTVLCLLVGATAGLAQQPPGAPSSKDAFATRQREAAVQNPADFSFTIRFADGKSTFQQGEIIRLELAFASSKPNAYSIDSAGYDRSGRLDIDRYVVDPTDGLTDPLRDYFESIRFSMMGGLRGNPTMTEKPYLINTELNEWWRIDRPGKYRLYVISNRASTGINFRGGQGFGVASNLLEFEVVPAQPKWAAQTAQDAAKTIDGSSTEEVSRGACRTLRFLNTEAAAREMIKRFGAKDDSCQFEYQFGLYGSSHRAAIVREMERQLELPTHPVSGSFIATLALNAWLLTDPAKLPPYPAEDEGAVPSWRSLHEQRQAAMKAFRDKYDARLAMAVTHKTGPALAVSLATIFDTGDWGVAREPALQAKLASVFLDLPANHQARLLNYRWGALGSPAMLPVLRKIFESPARSDGNDLPSLALRRLFELSPAEGRLLIMKELASARPRVSLSVLTMLPESELPALEQQWAEHLASDGSEVTEVHTGLIERYGTKAVLPGLRTAFGGRIGQIACRQQTSLLSYFLRVDEEFGIKALEQAMASREKTGCYHAQLLQVIDKPMTMALESSVLEYIDDPDLETAMSAVITVGKYGSPEAEAALWQRFGSWKQEMQGREVELADQQEKGLLVSQASYEIALIAALATSPAWFAAKEKLERIREQCVTSGGRQKVTRWIDDFDAVIAIDRSWGKEGQYSLAQYSPLTIEQLKSKALQFPKRTTFRWVGQIEGDPAAQSAFREMKNFLEQNDLALVQ